MQKILIVEDSLPILQLHQFLVNKAGFEAVTATTLAEVKSLEEDFSDFFCAIIDYGLPDAPDGEAIPYLLNNKVPGIVMTGMLDDKTRDTILKLPIIDYITKENKQAYNYLYQLLVNLKNNHKTNILVVDDAASSRRYIQSLLNRHNYNVLLASSGQEALNILKQNQDIKLVITDKEMPNMDGLELCNKIRATYTREEMSIIGISGADNSYLTAKFIKSGANDFLTKPFCLEEFYCRVNQNIDHIESIETIKRQANTDYLTELYNRRCFFESVTPLVDKYNVKDQSVSLVMMDIDHFKSVNDTYGHEAGDIVLKKVAALLTEYFPEDCFPARIGGEEFCLFLAITPKSDALSKLEKFREALANTKIKIGKDELTVTISIGLTSQKGLSVDQLVNKADELLYKAKVSGRNRIDMD